jgi:spore maturation protein SpmA
MALNYVWIAFFLIGFVLALYKLIFEGDTEIFKKLVDGIFDSGTKSVTDVAFPLAGTMIFFLGLLNIGEKAGLIRWLAKKIQPFFSRLFPEVPKDHPATGHMVMNFSANMLGLDNAATPFGLKAMEGLESLNPVKGKATNAQIMFLVLHTSGLTLIPLTIMTYRQAAGGDASSIFIPCIIATVLATLASILVVGIKQRIRFDGVLLSWIGGLLLFVGSLLAVVAFLPLEGKTKFAMVFGNVVLFSIIVCFLLAGVVKKINVFDAFIEGAKNGFDVVLKIIPYLVGMLVAIRVFRESGALNYLIEGLTWMFQSLGVNTDFVSALPVAIMKPFSGSGARGMMLDVFQNPALGPDSFAGQMASIFQGSADTTFYIIALYFGSVGIKNIRYSIWAGLLADFMGVIMAVIIAYLWFK